MRESLSRWILIWRWIVLAGLALLVLLIPTPVHATKPIEQIFRIEASQFTYSPAVLIVNPGDHVTIELVSTDVMHGLSIDGYNLEMTSEPGHTRRLTFIANQQGSFRFRCSVTCGNMHPFMIGKLQVGQNAMLWRGVLLAGLVLVAGVWVVQK
jgi:heme/copper-type cytochrome/quinol oxidase subunit 2